MNGQIPAVDRKHASAAAFECDVGSKENGEERGGGGEEGRRVGVGCGDA
jgi:hypothetical protein